MQTATATPDSVKPLIDASIARVDQMLPDIDQMTNEQLAAVLLTYRYTIEPVFIPWLAAAWGQCSSEAAKHASWDNLDCEMRDDHPKMLRDFTAPLEGTYQHPRQAIARCGALSVRVGREIATDAVSGLFVMALLENLSLTFIEWMRGAAKRLYLTDLTYLNVHGEADIAHANEFVRATDTEAAACGTQARPQTVTTVEKYLTAIFHAHAA